MQHTLFEEPKDETAPDVSTKRHKHEKSFASEATSDKIGVYAMDTVHAADCIVGMKNLPTASVDLAIADPPYNVSKGGNWIWDNSVKLAGFGGDWQKVMAGWDNMPLAEYFAFTLAWPQNNVIGTSLRLLQNKNQLWQPSFSVRLDCATRMRRQTPVRTPPRQAKPFGCPMRNPH